MFYLYNSSYHLNIITNATDININIHQMQVLQIVAYVGKHQILKIASKQMGNKIA